MVKYSIGAILLCLYAAGSAWVVVEEGRGYRESLGVKRLAARPTAAPAPNPVVVVKIEASAGPAASKSNPASPDRPPILAAAPASVEKKPRATPDPIAPAPKTDPIWDDPAFREVWDLEHLKIEDEIRLGRALHALVLRFNKSIGSGPWARRAEEAAGPLLKTRSRKGFDYTITILDSDKVFAFSHPGGYVYLSRGIFNLIAEDEDYALQFVVGHEIAHVDQQHAVKCLQDPEVKRLGFGTLKQFYFLIFPLGYMPDQDFAADRWVVERMKQLGSTRREMLTFLRRFEGYAARNGFENSRQPAEPNADSSPLENHSRAHPPAWKRLKELEALIPPASPNSR
jgi:hypothetical protein